MVKKSDGRGAAKGLTMDNMEDMAAGLRHASESARTAKSLRDAARLQKSRDERAKNPEKK